MSNWYTVPETPVPETQREKDAGEASQESGETLRVGDRLFRIVKLLSSVLVVLSSEFTPV